LKRNKELGVIGANSMVGSRFCELSELQLVKADLNGEISVDITEQESVENFFQDNKFETVILFSAFTDVDSAEGQRGNKSGTCWRVNVAGAKNVVEACRHFKRKLIFISTDFVFDGENGPYSETDLVGPNLEKVSWYGITKIEGEKLINNSLDDFMIIRISYPYRSRFGSKADFAKQILQRYDNHDLYPLFADQQITPTFIDDLAPCISLLLSKNAGGIYNLASPEPVSPYEFGIELIRIFGYDPHYIERGKLKTLLKKPGMTPRPLRGGMKTDKIEKLGFKPTDWKNGIREIFRQSNGRLI